MRASLPARCVKTVYIGPAAVKLGVHIGANQSLEYRVNAA